MDWGLLCIDTFFPGGWPGTLKTPAAVEKREMEITGHPMLSGAVKF
jgi:hypothetical protein